MEQEEITLSDGHVWSEEVFARWESEGKQEQIQTFAHLVHIVPQIYETLELFGYHKLARKLEKSVQSL